MMAAKPNAPSAERNKEAILEVLIDELRDRKTILEIGSGTGQHAIFFASEMPWLSWQTSDRIENHDGITAWLDDAKLDNVHAPLQLHVLEPVQFSDKFDAVFSANTAHIMSIAAVQCMFRIVSERLNDGGKFCLYGPFNQNGNFSSDSNRDFDMNLKSQDPVMGIRDLEKLDEFAAANGMRRESLYAMPANNMIAVWQKN